MLPHWPGTLLYTLLSDLFDPFPFTLADSLPGDILVFTSSAGTGLFASNRSRRREPHCSLRE